MRENEPGQELDKEGNYKDVGDIPAQKVQKKDLRDFKR